MRESELAICVRSVSSTECRHLVAASAASPMRKEIPRLPLDGKIDLTYRCNNRCQHCWLWIAKDAPESLEELPLQEIRRVVDEARSLGCQAWAISGGEPMLRPDFVDIFDYITRKAVHYSLNTNGTLITPRIARLLTRPGKKMVALYGASAAVHDQVTRNPGSFDATMRGLSYLKEASAGFIVQIIPMASNYHQYGRMLALAQSLSPHYRVGSSWLFMSACRSESRNHEIARERLEPATVVALEEPNYVAEISQPSDTREATLTSDPHRATREDDRLFRACIAARRDFHVDPYGQMSFCSFIKDPTLRFDLRRGSFYQAWEDFIPSLADTVRGGREYLENCGSCDLRRDCHWCAVYGWLEHGRFSARVDYLCRVAAEARRCKEDWKLTHVRYYRIAGITLQVAADFPITDHTFAAKFDKFQVDGPGEDTVAIRLVSALPKLSDLKLGQEVYHHSPWAIYRQRDSWLYRGITEGDPDAEPNIVAIMNDNYTETTVYRSKDWYEAGSLHALTTFPSDQLLLGQILADRHGCYLHASGIILEGNGLLFVGHSQVGKSTVMKMLRGSGEILCDDRIIVRRWPDGFRLHGTWSHGELPDISPADAPLRAILFLEQANTNELIPIADTQDRLGRALSHVVKPFVTTDWWNKTLDLAGKIATEVPAYRLLFDKSGQVLNLVRRL